MYYILRSSSWINFIQPMKVTNRNLYTHTHRQARLSFRLIIKE